MQTNLAMLDQHLTKGLLPNSAPFNDSSDNIKLEAAFLGALSVSRSVRRVLPALSVTQEIWASPFSVKRGCELLK